MVAPSDTTASESSSHSPATKPKVIYVMGQPKSGSTIFGVTLGNCDNVFYAGELCSWLLTQGEPVLGGTERVRFWKTVKEGMNDPDRLMGPRGFHLLERSSAPLRINQWRARRRLRSDYRRVTEELYVSIANAAGATHVVDSSHMPLRARELQSLAGIDLYLVFLVRNVEGVVGSFTRGVKRHDVAERRRRFLHANAHLWVTYLMSILVFLRQPRERRLLLRHEDFLANPEGVLREILDLAGSCAPTPDFSALSTGIPLKGAALIRSDVVALKAEPAPPHRQSRLMRTVQHPWTLVLDRLQPTATGAGSSGDTR